MLRGRRIEAMGSAPAHADRHCEVDYVIRAYASDGYVPSTGEYRGIASDRLKAYLLASHLGRLGSQGFSKVFPGVQGTLRDLFGWSA